MKKWNSHPKTGPNAARYWYSWGYSSEARAYDTLNDAIACGAVSMAEKPIVQKYQAMDGRSLWGATLLDAALAEYA